jgi:oligopeptide/dipeptide ABC transporter ATP-binding protein
MPSSVEGAAMDREATMTAAGPEVPGIARLLEIEHLSIEFPIRRRWTETVRDVSLDVTPGEVVGLVGESGSGKTLTCSAVLGLIPRLGGRVSSGSIRLAGTDVTHRSDKEFRPLRGKVVSMIFQQPTRSLNPAYTVGDQVSELLRIHLGMDRKAAWERAVELLDRVHIANARERVHSYPHQLSGGMCQRVMIALAIACEPQLLVADEPTTALDVTVQKRILSLIDELRRDLGLGILYVTHDLAIANELCDRINVMYAGEIVEQAGTDELFEAPRHPYTARLLAASLIEPGSSRMESIQGMIPPVTDMPIGCRFHPRCDFAVAGVCDGPPVVIRTVSPDHTARCARSDDIQLRRSSER